MSVVGTKLAMVNLIYKHDDQGRLGSTFDSVLSAILYVYGSFDDTQKQRSKKWKKTQPLLGPNTMKHVWYDFHAECKGGQWDKLVQLLEQITLILNKQGYFCVVSNATPSQNDAAAATWEI